MLLLTRADKSFSFLKYFWVPFSLEKGLLSVIFRLSSSILRPVLRLVSYYLLLVKVRGLVKGSFYCGVLDLLMRINLRSLLGVSVF